MISSHGWRWRNRNNAATGIIGSAAPGGDGKPQQQAAA
jgi:hypothetical protein